MVSSFDAWISKKADKQLQQFFFFSLKLQSVSALQRALKALGATIDFDMLVNKFLLFVILV